MERHALHKAAKQGRVCLSNLVGHHEEHEDHEGEKKAKEIKKG
jgi:hypothetical protein